MRIWKRCEYCLFAVLVVCASSRGATAQIATATLGGSIRDETGAALPGVMLTIKSASTGTTRTVTTDAGGRYRIAALDPGEYEIRAELQNRSEEHTSELQSRENLVCRLLLEKKK